MHFCAAKLLRVGLLAGRHLHERRPSQEDMRTATHEHRVVTEPRYVGSSRRGAPKDERDCRNIQRRQPRQVPEHRSAGHELLSLRGEVGPARLDEVDERQPVSLGYLLCPQGLAKRERVVRPTPDRGVVPRHHALDALHHTDTGDEAAADVVIGAEGDERLELEKRTVPVQQQLDALADEKLPAGTVALDVLRPASGARRGEQPIELLQPR